MHRSRKCEASISVVRSFRKAPLMLALSVSLMTGDLLARDLDGTSFNAWQGRQSSQSLADGSVLHHYSAFTTSAGSEAAEFRVEFMPRFNCAPLFLLESAQTSEGQPLADDELIRVVIDGEPVVFPVLVDDDGVKQQVYFNGNRQNRELLRRQIDVGDVLTWSPGGPVAGESDGAEAGASVDATDELVEPAAIRFSLLGSSRSVEAVQALCQAHVPEPWSK